MYRRRNARPENEREDNKGEKESGRAEDEEGHHCGVARDSRVGARFPDEGCGGERGAGQPHGERRSKEDTRGFEEGQSAQKGDESRQEDESGYETLGACGDPKIPHPPAHPEQQHVTSHEGRCGELGAHVKSSPKRVHLGERHESVERREDKERVQSIREKAGRVMARCTSMSIHEE